MGVCPFNLTSALCWSLLVEAQSSVSAKYVSGSHYNPPQRSQSKSQGPLHQLVTTSVMRSLILINAGLCSSAALPSLIKEVQMVGLGWVCGGGVVGGVLLSGLGPVVVRQPSGAYQHGGPCLLWHKCVSFFFHSPRKGNNRTHPIIEHCRVLKNV